MPDGYLILFCTETEWAHILSPSGALVWEFCDGKHTVEEIIQEIAKLIQSSHPDLKLKEEVSALVQELSETGLLQAS